MTVFKGYMKIARHDLGFILMYLGIFTFIAIMMFSASSMPEGKYQAEKLRLAVVDQDQSELSKELIEWLKKQHHVSLMENDKAVMQETLYYYMEDAILQIPEGFQKEFGKADVCVKVTQQPGNYNTLYLEQQITDMLNRTGQFMAAGYSVPDSFGRADGQEAGRVALLEVNENHGKIPGYGYMFRYFPYLFLAGLSSVLGYVLSSFRQVEVKKRMMASPVSLIRQMAEAICSFFIIGMMMYGVCIVIGIFLYGEEVINAPNLQYYLLNLLVLLLVTLSIAFIIGIVTPKSTQINTIMTPLSLGICFLSGVFVPLEIMNENVSRVSRLLPVYWYEKVNDLLINYGKLEDEVLRQVWQGLGIQVLFALALAGVAVAIMKYKQQER